MRFAPHHSNTLQHTATHSNTLQHTATQYHALRSSSPQHTATHCNTLQHTTIHYNTLQHTATHCSTLQHIATHCNTLLQTATHCNTLQHTATRCNTPQHIHATCNKRWQMLGLQLAARVTQTRANKDTIARSRCRVRFRLVSVERGALQTRSVRLPTETHHMYKRSPRIYTNMPHTRVHTHAALHLRKSFLNCCEFVISMEKMSCSACCPY